MTQRKKYTEEFKREAVKLVTDQGYSQAEAGRSLGVDPGRIWVWCKKYGATKGRTSGLDQAQATFEQQLAEKDDLIRRLLMEREILKKAAVFFANEKK